MTSFAEGRQPQSSRPLGGPVLIVDDDSDIREALGDALGQAGYSVLTASNGLEAMELLKTAKPLVILLDLYMPTMDGVAFRVEQLKDPLLATIPTVAVSAVTDMDARIRDLCFDAALAKPVELDVLLRTVARCCEPSSRSR